MNRTRLQIAAALVIVSGFRSLAHGNDRAADGNTFAGAAPSSSTWIATTGGNFNDPSKWFNNTIPGGAGGSATFSGSISAPATVTLAFAVPLGTVIFDNPTSPYTLTGGTLHSRTFSFQTWAAAR